MSRLSFNPSSDYTRLAAAKLSDAVSTAIMGMVRTTVMTVVIKTTGVT